MAQVASNPSGPASATGTNLNPQDQKLLQEFQQQHPNFAQNHPNASQYYQNHPKALDQGLDKYGMRQFGKNHQNWVQNHPKLSKFDYQHPQFTENHPGRALGLGGHRGRG